MDNISRRFSTEDTATSVYLSFDAESTVSTTACYKTMEAMSDISALSAIDMDDSVRITAGDNHMNSTLEAHDNSQIESPQKTVKKMEMPYLKHTPLRTLSKNILKEYKALCSTPSKEQLLKTVDVTRGSDANRCVDLGLAFLGVEDEKPAYFPPPPSELNEENKENALPETTQEVSTLSTCSSVETTTTTSVIERKMITSVSTVGSVTEEESVEELKIIKNVDEILVSAEIEINVVENNDNKSFLDDASISELKTDDMVEPERDSVETTPKAKSERNEYMETITESEEQQVEKTPVVKELETAKKVLNKNSNLKPKIAVLTRNVRRSICEPNIQTNKPSRILNTANKRQSLLPTSKKSTKPIDAEMEIPLLMSRMLKISKTTQTTAQTNNEEIQELIQKQTTNDQQISTPGVKRHSMKTRASLIPSAAGEKRSFGFTHRMSVVVKTTLNSPARKMARKSSMGGVMTSLQRRSVIPQKTTPNDGFKTKKPEVISRKSMLPKTSNFSVTTTKSNIANLPTLQEAHPKTDSIKQRHSLYPPAKVTEKGKVKIIGNLTQNKPDISFTCNVCKEKFRIKSLLDAHKRSHENDIVPPAFLKKPSTMTLSSSSGSSVGSSNQCKYCDKKFALTRALHIHLLQNCSKIPPSEKRKLQYTDLNHVEKAQLPNVFSHHNNLQNNAFSAASSVNATPRHAFKQNVNTQAFPKSSAESLNEKKDIKKITSDLVTDVDGTNMPAAQGSVQKIKKSTAHAGVYRTPSKSVPCHLCKLTFKSILDYTNHNLTVHGGNKTGITDDEEFVQENNA